MFLECTPAVFKMNCLTVLQRLTILQLCFNLDVEMAYYDAAMAAIIYDRQKMKIPMKRSRKRRLFWVKEWLLGHKQEGMFRFLMNKLRLRDVAAFKNFTRMEPNTFFQLLDQIEHRITKQDTFWRKAISAPERLAITLRFLASGETYMSLMYGWLVASNTIGKIVREVCQAINEELAPQYLSCPLTPEGWKKIADKFGNRWNFYHAVGAIDGKHVAIKKPAKSGSLYHNYKGFFSIILLAVVDADYKFLWVDVGANGGCSDAQIYNACELKEMLISNEIGLPPPEPLPGQDVDVPYFLIGDDAFALTHFLMKPYSRRNLTRPERIFNYRLSRARRIVENAFGILANRWGCLLTTLRVAPSTATTIVLACCTLHNILTKGSGVPIGLVDVEDEEHNLVPGQWRSDKSLVDAGNKVGGNKGSHKEKATRDYLCEFYNSPAGAVEWQDRMI